MPRPAHPAHPHRAVRVDPTPARPGTRDVLGMQICAQGRVGVLSFGATNDIALPSAPTTRHARPGRTVNPAALRARDPATTNCAACTRAPAAARHSLVKVTDHKVGFGVYFTDPDGHRFEFFARRLPDEASASSGSTRHSIPVDIDHLTRRATRPMPRAQFPVRTTSGKWFLQGGGHAGHRVRPRGRRRTTAQDRRRRRGLHNLRRAATCGTSRPSSTRRCWARFGRRVRRSPRRVRPWSVRQGLPGGRGRRK